MAVPGADRVLVRYGELGTKSRRVRTRMVEILLDHVDALLADRGLDAETEFRHARPLVHGTESNVVAAAQTAADAFGVVSTSPARRVEPDFEAILDTLATVAPDCYTGGTFAVDANRAVDDLPFTSPEIERDGGRAIWEAVEHQFDPAVDLEDPDVTFGVEVRRRDAYLYAERFQGPGGLPLGSQSPLVALVSGGIDSPVAAYEAMRRGSRIVPVYLDLGTYGGADHRARAVDAVGRLARFDPDLEGLFIVPAGEHLEALAEGMEYGRMLSFRRFMYSVAERIARDEGASGVVTGEAIGQKSSQTVTNLAVTSGAIDLPVHRPLLTVDKPEITERARELGTLEAAAVPAGCNRFAPDRPATQARPDRLLDAEPPDLFERAAAAAQAAEWVSL